RHLDLDEPRRVPERNAGPGFAVGDLEAEGAGIILALRADQVTAAVDHAAGDGKMTVPARDAECGLDQAVRVFEVDRAHDRGLDRVFGNRASVRASPAGAGPGPAWAG